MTRKRRDVLAHRDLYSFAAIVLLCVQVVVFRRFRIDDAFIAYRHARHLAEGLGPVMNAGERVEGVSNLPWTALLGLLAALGLEPHAVAPVLSFLCGLAVVGLTAALAARALEDRRAGGPAALFVAAAAPLAVWSVSGMETLAFTALLATLFFGALEEVPQGRGGWRAGMLLGGVAALRPEGIAYALPLFLAAPAARRWWVRLAFGAALVLAPFVLFRWLYYGDWLPNPVHAKLSPGTEALASGLLYVTKGALTFPWLWFALFGLPLCSAPRARLLAGWIATTFLVALVSGGERFPGYRLLLPAWPALAVGAETGLRRLQLLAHRKNLRLASALLLLVGVWLLVAPRTLLPLMAGALRWARLQEAPAAHAVRLVAEMRALGALALGLGGAGLWLRWRRHVLAEKPGAMESEVRGQKAAQGHLAARRTLQAALVGALLLTLLPGWLDPSLRLCRVPDPAVRFGQPVGEYLRRTFPPATTVATNCAGSLPYFAELPVIDMLGLTDAHIARVRPDQRQWIGHEKGDGAYVLSRHPDLIVLGGPQGSATPWPFPGDQQIVAAAEFQRDYTLQRVVLQDFEFLYYARHASVPAPR